VSTPSTKEGDLLGIFWVDITEYSGWAEKDEEPTPTWSVGFLHKENEEWLVLTDTQPKGNAVYYPKGCIRKTVKLSKAKMK